MGSKSKKLAKQIEHATKQVLSKKKRKKYASEIKKYAKKLAKKLVKNKEREHVADLEQAIEKNVEPTVWNSEVPETVEVQAVEEDK